MTVLWAFLAVSIAEALRAWRLQHFRAFASRAVVNVTLLALGAAVSMLLWGVSVTQLSEIMRSHGVGLLALVPMPPWLAILLGIVLLDLGEYVLHRLSHQVGWLWRLHSLHHSDRDVDVTTTFRFHPLNAVVIIGWHLSVMVAFGIPIEALLLRETANSLWALFQHSSAGKYGYRWQVALRHLLVMPAVHHYHHSIEPTAQSGNFGAVLACWDHLFGTAIKPPPHVIYGLAQHPVSTVDAALALPFTLDPDASFGNDAPMANSGDSALDATKGAARAKAQQSEHQ